MDVIMPKMGESVSEGTIIKWHKKIGDMVKRDEIIFEISTDKVDTEIPSPADGILSEIIVKEGETVEVGTTVAVVQTTGEPVTDETVDETLFEISTDKVDTEIPSPEDGILVEILVAEQKTVEVGTVVARLTSKSA